MKNALKIGTGILGGSSGATTNPLLAGLASFWSMNETSGNRADSIGTRHLEVTGTVGSAVGLIGNCVTMSGTGNCLIYVNAELLSINWAAGFTVAGWMYVPDSWSGRNTILAKEDNTVSDWGLYNNSQTQHRMVITDSVSGSSTAESTTSMTVNAWHFMASRYNPSTKKAEIRLDAEGWKLGAALSNGPANIKTGLRVGNYISLYGKANYDLVYLYTEYKSDAFVDLLYNGGAGASPI